jgi:hypothetical protein
MPKITPRFYTVASSSNLNNKKMNIVISLLSWKGVNGNLRYGLTSNYYKDIYENFKQFESIKIIRDSVSLSIPQQLLSVIPPAKSDIIDKSIRFKMKDIAILHMLPSKVDYDYTYKEKFWLCEAIMPYLDYEEIIKIK